tara:strand:- start:10697 stop:10816 length:120 start_codon:yes stop_codon:yes gene_type:complete
LKLLRPNFDHPRALRLIFGTIGFHKKNNKNMDKIVLFRY